MSIKLFITTATAAVINNLKFQLMVLVSVAVSYFYNDALPVEPVWLAVSHKSGTRFSALGSGDTAPAFSDGSTRYRLRLVFCLLSLG